MRPDRGTLESLFENAPGFVGRLLALDAETLDDTLERAAEVALEMPADEQVELLNAHPRIGAAPSSVSALSFREQGYEQEAGTTALQERLDELNQQYEARHGFRFVIFVSGRSRQEIADLMPQYLARPTGEERLRGLRDVIAIARARALAEDSPPLARRSEEVR